MVYAQSVHAHAPIAAVVLDITNTSWQPRVGERVRIVPNHVCVSVNLQPCLWLMRDSELIGNYPVAARGW